MGEYVIMRYLDHWGSMAEAAVNLLHNINSGLRKWLDNQKFLEYEGTRSFDEHPRRNTKSRWLIAPNP